MTRKPVQNGEAVPEPQQAEPAVGQNAVQPEAGLSREPAEAASGQSQADELNAQIARLREELVRRAAEFENFRKQKEREAAQTATRSLENTVRDLLPLLDDLKRLMHHIPEGLQASEEAKPFIAGVELIRKNFVSWLESKGVREIDARGQKLDVNFHEAITQIDHPDAESDTIVDEYQAGYTLGDRVIRHAKVIVAK